MRHPAVDSRDRMKAFGLSLDTQIKIIDEMTALVRDMRVIGKTSMLPFQTGIITALIYFKLL